MLVLVLLLMLVVVVVVGVLVVVLVVLVLLLLLLLLYDATCGAGKAHLGCPSGEKKGALRSRGRDCDRCDKAIAPSARGREAGQQ